MLLDRIESPVPDWTETPARTLKAIVLPAPDTVPPIVLENALLLTITPFTSLPSGALPVMSVPIRLPSTRLSLADLPSSRTPQWLAEIRFKAAAVVPPIVLLYCALDQHAFVLVAQVILSRVVRSYQVAV